MFSCTVFWMHSMIGLTSHTLNVLKCEKTINDFQTETEILNVILTFKSNLQSTGLVVETWKGVKAVIWFAKSIQKTFFYKITKTL